MAPSIGGSSRWPAPLPCAARRPCPLTTRRGSVCTGIAKQCPEDSGQGASGRHQPGHTCPSLGGKALLAEGEKGTNSPCVQRKQQRPRSFVSYTELRKGLRCSAIRDTEAKGLVRGETQAPSAPACSGTKGWWRPTNQHRLSEARQPRGPRPSPRAGEAPGRWPGQGPERPVPVCRQEQEVRAVEETPSAQAGSRGCLHSFSERRVSLPVGGAEPSVTTDGSREEAARTPPTTGDLEPGHPSARQPRCWNSSSCAQRAPTGDVSHGAGQPGAGARDTQTSPAWRASLPSWRAPREEPRQPLLPSSAFHHPARRRSPSCEQTALQSPPLAAGSGRLLSCGRSAASSLTRPFSGPRVSGSGVPGPGTLQGLGSGAVWPASAEHCRPSWLQAALGQRSEFHRPHFGTQEGDC